MALDLQEVVQSDVVLAVNRQRDGAAFDMRVLDGVIAGALLASNDSQLNAAVRIPTTLSAGDAQGQIAPAK